MRALFSCAFCLCIGVSAANPLRAEVTLTTTDNAIVFIASGSPRESFGTAYISDGGADRARLETELGYAGVSYDRYVTLSNANARDMLTDTDMVTALPLRLLSEPFAAQFFAGSYFAFVATPSGLEAATITRPDGATIDAQDISTVVASAPAILRVSDGQTTILATTTPLDPSALDVRMYGMTMPREWLADRLAGAGIELGELSGIGAEQLTNTVSTPGEAVIFLSQNQEHPTIAPIFDGALGARFYVVTNFGILPAQPEAASPPPAEEATVEAVDEDAQPETEAVAAAVDPAPSPQDDPVATPPAAASDAPYFDLTSSEVYILVAADQAALDGLTSVYVPRLVTKFTNGGAERSQVEVIPFVDHDWRQKAVHRYLQWIAADRGGYIPAFSRHNEFRVLDGVPMEDRQTLNSVPAILSSELARDELSVARDIPGAAFAILDRRGITQIRPVIGVPPDGPVLTIAHGQDEGFADAHRRMRSQPNQYVILPADGGPIRVVYMFSAARSLTRQVDLSAIPEDLRGPQSTFVPTSITPISDLPPVDQVRLLNEPGTAFVYGRNWIVDFIGDPVFDRLFAGDRPILGIDGQPLDLEPFPVAALRASDPQGISPGETNASFCGIASGPFLLANEPRTPVDEQGQRFMIATGDTRAIDLATTAGYGRARQYYIATDDELRGLVGSLRINRAMVFSGPEVANRALGAGFDCDAGVVTPF